MDPSLTVDCGVPLSTNASFTGMTESSLANLGNVGGAISYVRDAMGLSQSQLAEKLSIGKPALSMIENNKRTPTLRTLCEIASALGDIPIHALFMKANALANSENPRLNVKADAIISMHIKLSSAAVDENKTALSSEMKELVSSVSSTMKN